MSNLKVMRQRLMVAAIVLAVLNVAFVVYLFRPGGSSKDAMQAQVDRLNAQLAHKKLEAEPLVGVDKKLAQTRIAVQKFYEERVISRFSQISEQVQKLALANGVSATQVIRYKPEDTGLPNLQKVEIETSIAGDYATIAHFINALERAKPLFLINEVSLSSPQGGMVELRITFETFLKETA